MAQAKGYCVLSGLRPCGQPQRAGSDRRFSFNCKQHPLATMHGRVLHCTAMLSSFDGHTIVQLVYTCGVRHCVMNNRFTALNTSHDIVHNILTSEICKHKYLLFKSCLLGVCYPSFHHLKTDDIHLPYL